jgi:hypothetical protein
MSRSIEALRRVFAAAALVAAAALGCTEAHALDGRFCDAYALEAVKLAREIRDNACLFETSHPQWSMDINVHKRWCMTANEDSVDRERDNRRSVAAICSNCRTYARNAMVAVAKVKEMVAAAKAAKENVCQTSGGPRWSENEDDHYKWCAGLLHIAGGAIMNSAADDETRARAQELGTCVAQTKGPLVAEPAKPEVAKPYSSSRSNTARSVPGETGARRLSKSNPELQGAKRRSKTGKVLRSPDTRVTRSAPCIGAGGHPCGGNRGVMRPGLLDGDGGFAAQGPSATGTKASGPGAGRPGGGAAGLR